MDDYIGDLDYLNDIRDAQLAPPDPDSAFDTCTSCLVLVYGLYYSPNNKDFSSDNGLQTCASSNRKALQTVWDQISRISHTLF